MENNTFKPDYSKIKLRVILFILLDIILLFFCLVLTVFAASIGVYSDYPFLSDLVSLVVGVLFAHLIMSAVFTFIAFRSTIKSLTIEDDGFSINGVKYSNSFDPDNLKGTGITVTGGIMPLLIPAAGINFIISSAGSKERPLKKTFWTGPAKDKDAVKLRKDFMAYLKPYFDSVNDEHYEKVKETIATKPIKVTINADKFHSAVVMISILFGLAILLMVYGAFSSFKFIVSSIILLVGAAVMAFILIRFIVNQKKCTSDLLTEFELSDTSITANGSVYPLYDTEIDMYYISRKAADFETSLRCAPPTKDTPLGMYITLKDAEKSCRHWIGGQLDSESTGVVILLKFAKKLQEERQVS